MSVAYPTLLPRTAAFPTLLPKPPQPHPLPLPRYGQRPARLNATRNLAREMEDLSEEEDELEEVVRFNALHNPSRFLTIFCLLDPGNQG